MRASASETVAFLRTVVFQILFFLGSIVAVLLAVPASAMGSRQVRRHALNWARYHGWCCRNLLGIHTRIEGDLPDGQYVFVSKHQAMYETIDLLRWLRQPAIVFKRELTEIPVWGWVATRYGAIPVDREGSASALRAMLRSARQLTADGRSILIFPEGTRVPPGTSPPLRPGFAGLYKQMALPVIPIALDSGRLWKRGRFIRHAGIVTIRFGELIPAGLPRAEAEAAVHAGINAMEIRDRDVDRFTQST